MSTKVTLTPSMQSEEVKEIFQALTEGNNAPRFVGGCVRDALLGKEAGDIDIATAFEPDKVITVLAKRGIRTVPTGIKHGTVTAISGRKQCEITTLRKDVACDGRHAEVEYTDSWEEDAARRDFTMNAMSCGLDGTLYDYFGGKHDLEKAIVRFVGDASKRVQEDYLRILRFFRFAAYYNKGALDSNARAACKAYAAQIDSLSGERIQVEMFKLLKAGDILPIIQVMQEADILPYIMLETQDISAISSLLVLEKEQKLAINPLVRIASLLRHSVFEPRKAVLGLVARWRLSNRDGLLLRELVCPSVKIIPDMNANEQKSIIRKAGKELFCHLVYLGWAENGKADSFKAMIALANEWDVPEFPVTGNDILSLGIKSGQQVGMMLKEADQWWEKEDYKPSKADIIAWIKKQFAIRA